MRLLEVRLEREDSRGLKLLSDEISSLFSRHKNGEVGFVHCDPELGMTRRKDLLEEITKIVLRAVKSSFDLNVDYANCLAIKSYTNCLLIVFEDDGLVRIVVPHKYLDILLTKLASISPVDRTDVLIETDLLDDF